MRLKIIVIPTLDDNPDMRDSEIIDEAQHNLLNLKLGLWEEAVWAVEREPK